MRQRAARVAVRMAKRHIDEPKKFAVGAAGTKATIQRLQELGFRPIGLERSSSGFKIWKTIKINRVRVPDILCLKSRWRFESRGKTNPEISMSHSKSDPNRAWDAGMHKDDFVECVSNHVFSLLFSCGLHLLDATLAVGETGVANGKPPSREGTR
jgi:hypothetical protein